MTSFRATRDKFLSRLSHEEIHIYDTMANLVLKPCTMRIRWGLTWSLCGHDFYARKPAIIKTWLACRMRLSHPPLHVKPWLSRIFNHFPTGSLDGRACSISCPKWLKNMAQVAHSHGCNHMPPIMF